MEKDKRNLDESKMFSDELIDALNKKTQGDQWDVKRYIDGEPKNVNPLTEIPEPQMRLYGFLGVFKSVFFNTERQLIAYVKAHNTEFGSICVMDYLGKVAGCNDVIRLTYKNGKSVLYRAIDEDGYGKYNPERSIYRGEFVWEYNHGRISEMYSAFRDRGIVFEDDVYAKIDERNRKIITMLEQSGKQVLTKKRTMQNPSNNN